jgi:hypothetical protein
VLGDGYVLDNRPSKELAVLDYLAAGGFPAPEPLGAVWERRGMWLRGALATRAIEAEELARAVGESAALPVELLRRTGETLRRMHEYGVYHADLNARNILVGGDGVYVIDFDNARVCQAVSKVVGARDLVCGPSGHGGQNGLSGVARARNLLRLRRSIDKLGLPERAFGLICEGYGVTSLPIWLDRLYRWKGALSDLASGRVRSHAP